METLLLLLASVAGLLTVALWWIRRTNLAVYPPGRRPPQLRTLPAGCELGARLLAATATDAASGTREAVRAAAAEPAAPK
ncbi:MAG TPA: hypothetical protein VG452_13340, partial [Egibacteraceae bacterium]|nr:hypothetical protein [Egibacteraceae bacterium]